MIEGTIPTAILTPQLKLLALPGRPNNAAALRGSLPREFARAAILNMLGASQQALEGVIPPLMGSLHTLGLQNNGLKVMSDVRFDTQEFRSSVFLHNNLLSCQLPRGAKTTTARKISLTGLGNQLSLPKRGFPEWVFPMDREKLFWVRDRDALDLVMRVRRASMGEQSTTEFGFYGMSVVVPEVSCPSWLFIVSSPTVLF